jgi:putative nucleotidyltransferase with HDIG domain
MAVLEHAIGKSLELSGLIRENQSYQTHLEEEIKKRTLELETSSNELRALNKHLSREIKDRIIAEDKLIKSLDRLERSMEGTIRTISHIAEIRDPYTGGHQQRVASLSKAIAREMCLSAEEVQGVHIAAMLHDIGKISVPIEILVKPGNLSILEIMYIRNHSQSGHDILQMVDFPWPVAQIVLQHHERIDGSGYPQGLTGDCILLYAKIIGVADVVESMASHRPYRSALGIDEALAEITGNSANLYDARVAKACRDVFIKKNFNFVEDTFDLMLRNNEVT